MEKKTITLTDLDGITIERTEIIATMGECLGTAIKKYDENGNLIYERYSSYVVKTHLYENGKHIATYDPSKQGSITAIRIFYDDARNSMAELVFAFGGTEIIEWTNVRQREVYEIGINGYTFVFDERPNMVFNKLVR